MKIRLDSISQLWSVYSTLCLKSLFAETVLPWNHPTGALAVHFRGILYCMLSLGYRDWFHNCFQQRCLVNRNLNCKSVTFLTKYKEQSDMKYYYVYLVYQFPHFGTVVNNIMTCLLKWTNNRLIHFVFAEGCQTDLRWARIQFRVLIGLCWWNIGKAIIGKNENHTI